MAVWLSVLALCLGVAVEGAAATPGELPTSLTVTYWPDEQQPQTLDRWTVRCNPPRGTLPSRRVACRRLARLTPEAFAPVPPGSVCTQVYGGPQKAIVSGTLRGKRLWSSFRRRNGCEIARWQRFSPWLIPAGGVTSP